MNPNLSVVPIHLSGLNILVKRKDCKNGSHVLFTRRHKTQGILKVKEKYISDKLP